MTTLPCTVLNEEFTGVSQETLRNYLEIYEEFLNLIPDKFCENKDVKDSTKDISSTTKEDPSQVEIINRKFISLTRGISNKYFGGPRQDTLVEEHVGNERKLTLNTIKTEKRYNAENVFKKRFLFWIINNYENQRVPYMNFSNLD
ncbi:hypothetical protein OJ253_1467 [Cryptosporidium canis]|uniref:Uncharacterized protein n=1 Tax=Cryptosporidium canis TaxID=195482 RepID=A0A9D5DMG5_9CRYT|nr:hypothetical protein OJ253_1467 [Cryptosporidium canis]